MPRVPTDHKKKARQELKERQETTTPLEGESKTLQRHGEGNAPHIERTRLMLLSEHIGIIQAILALPMAECRFPSETVR